ALLACVPRGHDEFRGGLVLARLLALGRLAPRGHRVAAAGGTAFAAAMRVIDRVHGDAAIVRTPTEPARAPGLADRGIHVIGVRHRANGGETLAVDEALLAGIQP